jgi:hypothetical protein
LDSRARLRDNLARTGVSRLDKLLLCLSTASAPMEVKEIRSIALDAGLRDAKDWNVSAILGAAPQLVVRSGSGWELTSEGDRHAARVAGVASVAATAMPNTLRAHLAKIADQASREFVEEAIRCYESGLFRAAVVLSWVGALAILQEHVARSELKAFNAEAARRDPKWRTATNRAGFAHMREFDFLQVLEAISVIDKSVKQELEQRLKLRNGCGHPSSIRVSDNMAAAHIESLTLNVFARF